MYQAEYLMSTKSYKIKIIPNQIISSLNFSQDKKQFYLFWEPGKWSELRKSERRKPKRTPKIDFRRSDLL